MLAIIPARVGSKGLPGKNIKPFNGKPLLYYTIEAARRAETIDRIILSTDDGEIASVGKGFGAEVPFMRPAELAGDDSAAIDTYIYTIERLNTERGEYNEFVVLQPTSPLRNPQDIDRAVEIFRERNADSVISVTEAPYPPQWIRIIDGAGILHRYYGDSIENRNRQEYEKTYVPNGAVFVFKFALLKNIRNYYSDKTYPYIMPAERSIDIDSMLDFEIAECLERKHA